MNKTQIWYQSLIKPQWAPAPSVFGIVWPILYAIIAISFGTVFYKAFTGKLAWIVALPFALNLVFNFAFTPIQFGLNGSTGSPHGNNLLAAVDILLVLGTLVWAMIAIWGLAPQGPSDMRWIAYAQIPYLLWVSFATVLQLTITHLNR